MLIKIQEKSIKGKRGNVQKLILVNSTKKTPHERMQWVKNAEISSVKRSKKRSDRKHLVYEIEPVKGLKYVGVTGMQKQAVKKTMKTRFSKHVDSVKNNPTSMFHKFISKSGIDVDKIKPKILDIARGKATAHELEREYIKSGNYLLNTSANPLYTGLNFDEVIDQFLLPKAS